MKLSRAGLRVLPLAIAAVLAAGCGTERAEAGAGAATPAPTVAKPSTPTNFPCPGESRTPSPSPTTADTPERDGPPADHYAENHGFREPFQLYGQSRCDGLTAVKRVKGALEPLRERGDFAQKSVQAALTGLGYPAANVRSYEDGPEAAGFRVEVSETPLLCVEGRVSPAAAEAESFGGYPDHSGCETPSGGH
ncbi:hypothetical protein AB0I49_20010 [Streptomyces sp. NPDC050617]|uniref:hypothetical protein n=1 Tax=Streptomyces sp. NPDC050617 TaxID=3154628 RepID=UPI00343BACCC